MTLDQALTFKRDTKDDLICTFISHPHITRNPTYPSLGHILRRFTQESYSLVELAQQFDPIVPLDSILENHSLPIDIYPGKTLNINSTLEPSQQDQLVKIL